MSKKGNKSNIPKKIVKKRAIAKTKCDPDLIEYPKILSNRPSETTKIKCDPDLIEYPKILLNKPSETTKIKCDPDLVEYPKILSNGPLETKKISLIASFIETENISNGSIVPNTIINIDESTTNKEIEPKSFRRSTKDSIEHHRKKISDMKQIFDSNVLNRENEVNTDDEFGDDIISDDDISIDELSSSDVDNDFNSDDELDIIEEICTYNKINGNDDLIHNSTFEPSESPGTNNSRIILDKTKGHINSDDDSVLDFGIKHKIDNKMNMVFFIEDHPQVDDSNKNTLSEILSNKKPTTKKLTTKKPTTKKPITKKLTTKKPTTKNPGTKKKPSPKAIPNKHQPDDEKKNLCNIPDRETKIIKINPPVKSLGADDKKINWVFHLADIHIHTENLKVVIEPRDEEYEHVFRNLDKEFSRHVDKLENSVIVVCGDVLDKYGQIRGASFKLFNLFFETLLKHADVILIYGNHDGEKTSGDILVDGMLQFVEKIQNQPHTLHYLQKTGYYDYGNIRFTVNSVFDGYAIDNNSQTDKIKISLYHGIVDGSNLQNDQKARNVDIDIREFKGFDFLLLGDIHKHQFFGLNKTAGYPSSLIQQNHGESVKEHGMILWDLINKKGAHIAIKNKFCFLTFNFEKKDNNLISKHNPETLCALEGKPRKIKAKVIYKNMTQSECFEHINKLFEACKEKNPHELIGSPMWVADNFHFNSFKNILDSSDKIPKNKLDIMKLEDQNEAITEYILNKEPKFGDKNIEKILGLNEKFYKEAMDSMGLNKYMPRTKNWWPIALSFSNLFCYGENNHINFIKFGKKKCVGFKGRNNIGKSSIIEVLVYALYGEFIRSNQAWDNVNKNADPMTFEVCLDFIIDGTIYRIIRKSITKKKTETRLFILIKKSDEPKDFNNEIVNEYFSTDLILNHPHLLEDDDMFIDIDDNILKTYIKTKPKKMTRLLIMKM